MPPPAFLLKYCFSNMSFHGVIPRKKAESLGQIALDVVFGDSKHFRKEKLTFEVVDF